MNRASDAHAGQAVYSKFALSFYDLLVLGISNRWIWKCPTSRLLGFYNKNITGNHLDVGVGTGYFLDCCKFPVSAPRVALLDMNQNCLTSSAWRIARYTPTSHQANVLEPIEMETAPFNSIAINYLLHCLPGTFAEKALAFDHLKPYLASGGTLFGSTILHDGVNRNLAARRLMKLYNRKGIFCNEEDDLNGLETELEKRYADWSVEVAGCVAMFVARDPR